MNDKRERILTVAQGLFAHFGFNKTTLDEIAHKARIGKSTLYYYFNSKIHIFSYVIKKESLALRNELLIAISNAKTPQGKLTTYYITRIKFFKKLVNYYTALTVDYLEHYSFVEKAQKDFTKFEFDTISEILHEGQKQGVFHIKDIASTAGLIVLAMKGLEVQQILKDNPKNLITTTEKMLSILFKGVEVR